MAAKVFISYRRDDSAGQAGRIQDRLEREFGRDLLFMDVDAIPLGRNFVKVLHEEVAKCGVLLAVIGPHWLDLRDEDGNRRLDNPNDFVHIEIAAALQRDIPVIPILLDGARVPKARQLPKDLEELALRNGLDVRHASFHYDMDKLIRGLKGQLGQAAAPPASSDSRQDKLPAEGRPEPAPELPEDEVSPPITPPEAPVVDAPLTLSEPPAIDQPVMPPEPAVVDQVVTTPAPAVADEPVLLSEPPAVDRPIAPPEQAPLKPAANEATAGGAEWKLPAQEPRPISEIGVVLGIGSALAVILLGSYFYLDSTKRAELPQHEASSTSNQPSASPPLTATVPSVLPARQEKEKAAEPGSEFTDCANGCPQMIVVPAGAFTMGSSAQEIAALKKKYPSAAEFYDWEGPQRVVTIARPFAVAKYEVTFAEWDACAAAGACPKAADAWGRGRMPVINVSWDEAKQYAGWLSRVTGKDYRLLTEAEWEYAARAGTATAYFWGDKVGKGNANCDGCGSQWDRKQTAPVGSFKPNTFGLYDMAGNVWEWCEDVWHDNYKGAPTDGSAWLQGGDASRRVVRGGSWDLDPRSLRAANRDRVATVDRDSYLGFRVGRTLTP